jgi:hypothetical protein
MLQITQRRINVLLAVALAFLLFACEKSDNTDGTDKNPGSGKGGSMARFTVACNHLYVVDESSLYVMDISNPADPQLVKTINVGFGIETIFPYKDYLLIGSSTGMFVFDNTNCDNPVYLSQFAHVMSCDPVVAENNLAYVTLRAGGTCRVGWTTNELDILNISNMLSPTFLTSHMVTEPYGLGIDNNTLFICHGDSGLGIYDVTDPYTLISLYQFPSIKSYDVIPDNNILVVTGPGGIYQYDYSDLSNLVLLSTIPVP